MNICMRFLMCPFFTWSLLFLTSSMSAQNDSVQTGFLNKGVALAERVLDLLNHTKRLAFRWLFIQTWATGAHRS